MDGLTTLLGGVMQTYILLFGVLIVLMVIVIFKISGASWPGLVASFFTSLLLTCLVFVMVNPGYAMTVFINLLIGFGAMGLLYFSRSWSGFAASVVVAMVVLSMVMYATHPGYGLTIAVIFVLALVAFAVLMVVAYGIKNGYSHQKPDKYSVTTTDSSGNQRIETGTRGGLIGPGRGGQQTQSRTALKGLVAEAQDLFDDPSARAKYLLLNCSYDEVSPLLDKQTAREMLLLESPKQR